MSDKTPKIIIAALLVGVIILGVMNTNLNNRITSLESDLQNINNGVQGLYSMQQDISAKIGSMNEQAAQSAKLSFDETTLVKGFHATAGTVDVDVSFGLKQFGAEDIVNVAARGENGKTFDAVATSPAAGRFSATLSLPVQDYYTLSFTTSGSTNTAGELAELYMSDELCGRFKYMLGNNETVEQGKEPKISLFPVFINHHKGSEALKIKEISIAVESGSTVVGTWDLTPYLNNESDAQTLAPFASEEERLRIAAGEAAAPPEQPANIITFTMPIEGALARLSFTDSMGVRYEQTDWIYIYQNGNGGGGGGGATAVPARPIDNIEHGDGYIHFAAQE